jgi:hypothetical protein
MQPTVVLDLQSSATFPIINIIENLGKPPPYPDLMHHLMLIAFQEYVQHCFGGGRGEPLIVCFFVWFEVCS